MKGLLKEYRSIIFALVIALVIICVAFVTFEKLSGISQNISNSIRDEVPASLISKQVLLELRTTENNALSYYLTKDPENIRDFFRSTTNIENLLRELERFRRRNAEDTLLLDSIAFYSNEGLRSLEKQPFLENSERLIGTLEQLNKKIDKLYTPREVTPQTKQEIVKKDTVASQERTNLFKRLFNKKRAASDTLKNTSKSTMVVVSKDSVQNNALAKTALKAEIKAVKSKQTQIIEETKQSEYMLAQSIFLAREKINSLIEELQANENARKELKTKGANEEVKKLKLFTTVSSSLILIFLIILIYFILSYINKKNEYTLMLIEGREQAEKLANSKEQFLANMSHEIKTPLNAIQGFSELLLTTALNEEQSQQANIIKNSATYLTKLVNNVLTYARFNSGKIKQLKVGVNLKDELNEFFSVLESQTSKKGIQLKLNVTELKQEEFLLDIDKLKQILFNIIGNAIKFTERGSVTLKVIHDVKNGSLIFKTTDTGVGISPDTLPKLFNEFEQGGERTQIKFGGTGLGLVITKKIIEELGGEITIKSKMGVGTKVTFSILVEQTTDAIQPVSQIEAPENLSIVKGKKVLIVDDEEYNRLLLKSILSKWDAVISEAVNGKEALDKVRNASYDLVIMDARMPVMNGVEATLEIRKQNPTIPILGATAVMSEEKIARCMNAGMDNLIFKPYSIADLSAKISAVLNNQNNSNVVLPLERSEKANENFVLNLNALDDAGGKDETFKNELIAVFYKSLNEGIEKINLFHRNNDKTAISGVAHKIIPSCRHLEAFKILAILKYLEPIKNNSTIDEKEYDSQIDKLNSGVKEINVLLEIYLKKNK